MLNRLRARLTYANVTATLALFVALGGSAYAATSLPRDSVGARQIRAGAVGTSELHSGAVHLSDLAKSTRASLHGASGAPGPAGPAGAAAVGYFATISGSGELVRGNANSESHLVGGSGSYTIGFPINVSTCAYSATPGTIDTTSQPAGIITVRDDGGKVGVQTYNTSGVPTDMPFHLIVAC